MQSDGGRPATACRASTPGVTKRFGRLTVLRDVSLRIGAGEVVALVGENGAGKSSLVACLARILEPEEGEVRLDGAPLPSTPDQVRQAGVEVLWQDHGLCDDLDVVANVFLGRERGRWMIAESDMREGAASVLRRVGADTLPLDRPGARAVPRPAPARGPRSRALWSEPRCRCSTSPRPRSGVTETLRVQDVIRQCRDAGAGILLVTHDLDQVFALADRVVVLRDGRSWPTSRRSRCTATTSWRSCPASRWTRWPGASSSGCAASSTSCPTSSPRRRCR